MCRTLVATMDLKPILFLTCMALCPPIHAKTTSFLIDAEEHQNDDGETSRYQIALFLEEDEIELASRELSAKWDFSKDMVAIKKGETGRPEHGPLFATVSSRVLEFEQEKAVLAAGGSETPTASAGQNRQIFLEHSFSISDGGKADIAEVQEKGHILYSYDGSPLCKISTGGVEADEWTLERFVMFLRHSYGGHPQVLQEVKRRGRIPQEISIWRYSGNKKIVTLRIKSGGVNAFARMAEGPQKEGVGDGGAGAGGLDELSAIEKTISNWGSEDYEHSVRKMKDKLKEALESNKNLEAFALALGISIAEGEMPEQTEEIRRAISGDGHVQVLLASLSPQSQAEGLKAIGDIKKLQSRISGGKAPLGVILANLYSMVGNQTEAIDTMIEALREEPALAGAWKDLGDDYYEIMDTQAAWRCYNISRKLNPHNPAAKDIEALEKGIRAQYPDFFLRKGAARTVPQGA